MLERWRTLLLAGASIALAATSGFLVASALGVGAAQEPVRTVTVDVGTGPVGPTGPTGPPGAIECPTGYSFGSVVFNTPGGHQQIATCLKD